MGRVYIGSTFIGFACFIFSGCSMSAVIDPINFGVVIGTEAEVEAGHDKRGTVSRGDTFNSINQVESPRTAYSGDAQRLYQNGSDHKESSGKSIIDSETLRKRSRVMKANGEESCRLLDEGLDSSDSE